MQKSAKRIFEFLFVKRLNWLVLLSILILGLSLLIFFITLKSGRDEDLGRVAKQIDFQCKKDASTRCVRSVFAAFAKGHEFELSKKLLGEVKRLNPKFEYCHALAHSISIAEVEKNPQNWTGVFKYVPSDECSYGYYHGVIEGKYRYDPEFLITSSLIEEVCLQKQTDKAGRCVHAFGHVILVQNQGDLTKTLDECEQLDSKVVDNCYQGVFMEDVQRENLSDHGITFREEWNKEYLNRKKDYCNSFKGDEEIECWRSLGPVINSIYENKINQGILICEEVSMLGARAACVREVVGFDFIKRLAKGENSGNSCKILQDNFEDYRNCVVGLVQYVLLTSVDYKRELSDYCDVSLIRDDCLRAIKEFAL